MNLRIECTTFICEKDTAWMRKPKDVSHKSGSNSPKSPNSNLVVHPSIALHILHQYTWIYVREPTLHGSDLFYCIP